MTSRRAKRVFARLSACHASMEYRNRPSAVEHRSERREHLYEINRMRLTIIVPLIIGSLWSGSIVAASPDVRIEDSIAPARAVDRKQSAALPSTQSKPDKPFDVKNVFRNICGFCHEDYGRHAGKGPQLMNSERSDEYMVNRIKHGMPGRMPAWSSVFTDDQIRQIVKFIRSLKPDEEPENPS
jgi:cytochrome c553